MFKIESPIKHGGVWDAKNNCLFPFEDGVMTTNDADLAEKCKEIVGFTVTGSADDETPNKFEGMDVEQLKVYASTNGIDIGNSSSVNGIIKKIVDAEAAKS